MGAPTWTLLAPDAPEPGPLSVVRDRSGGLWMHDPDAREGDDGRWLSITNPEFQAWSWNEVQVRVAPLHLGTPDGVLMPLTASTEPSPYEVRRDALNAAAARLNGWEGDHTDDLERADRYVAWLQAEPGA